MFHKWLDYKHVGENELIEIEYRYTKHEIRNFYQEAKKTKKGYQHQTERKRGGNRRNRWGKHDKQQKYRWDDSYSNTNNGPTMEPRTKLQKKYKSADENEINISSIQEKTWEMAFTVW